MPNIKSLDVLLEGHHIGTLYEDASGKHTFTYNLSASNSDLAQLSLSMPRHVEPWTGLPVEAYIDGVLPDSADVRQRIARQYGSMPGIHFLYSQPLALTAAAQSNLLRLNKKICCHKAALFPSRRASGRTPQKFG